MLDTGPLYALLDDKDGQHAAAVKLLEELEQRRAEVRCAYPAVLETHRLILTRKRVLTERAHFLIANVLEIFPPEMALREDAATAVTNLLRYADQKISLTDATIAAMSQRLGYEILAFEQQRQHFHYLEARVYKETTSRLLRAQSLLLKNRQKNAD